MKTNVNKHKRKTKKGRTDVVRHKRRIPKKNSSGTPEQPKKRQFSNRQVRFDQASYKDLDDIKAEYQRDDPDYRLPDIGTTDPKGSSMEMVLSLDDGSREHHRIYEHANSWKIESHIDLRDPMKDPIGHAKKDVVDPEIQPQMREENFNDTQTIYLRKG